VFSENILDDGQRNCPKHLEFYSKNKFEKLAHLVGFIIGSYHDARSPERQILRNDAPGPVRAVMQYQKAKCFLKEFLYQIGGNDTPVKAVSFV